jgi:hypothetical protein
MNSTPDDLAVGDIWEDGIYRRAIVAVYERDVLVHWRLSRSADEGRGGGTLPKRLFAEGRCGVLVKDDTATSRPDVRGAR